MVVTTKRLEELHSKMLTAQNDGGGFDLTFKEIISAWGYQSKAAASHYLPLLEEAGLVKSKKRGTRTAYRAVERDDDGKASN